MNVPKALFDEIKEIIKSVIQSQSIELEAVYSGTINAGQFKHLIKYYRKNKASFEETQSVVLDVSDADKSKRSSNMRVTIQGIGDISSFCKSDGRRIPENVEVVEKSKKTQQSMKTIEPKVEKFDTFRNFRLNMKQETKKKKDDIKSLFPFNKSTFRLKKRHSFQSGSFRVDMTLVRQFDDYSGSFSERNLLNAKEKHEVEIEFLPPSDTDCSEAECSQMTKNFFNLLYTIQCIFSAADKKSSVDESVHESVVRGYRNLLGLPTTTRGKSAVDRGALSQKEFLSYKPVTLQVSNLDEKCKGVPGNILKNYAVTEKADGDRMLLFVHDSKAYFLNDQKKIVYTGIQSDQLNSMNDTIIDGEFIKKDKRGEKLDLFVGFDVYFDSGKDVRKLPFMEKETNRYGLLEENIAKLSGIADETNSVFKFKSKRFVYNSTNVFQAAQAVIESGQYDYKIDGLIFQPINLGCGDLYLNQFDINANKPQRHSNNRNSKKNAQSPVSTTLSTTWHRVYKWKPPLENTIDFMIKIPDVDRTLVSSLSCELRAHNNYDDSRVELGSIAKILGGSATRNDRIKNYVVFARQDFNVADLEGVKNGDVWEFNFDDKNKQQEWIDQNNNKQKGVWRKHKKREDKTRILNSKNQRKQNVDDYDLSGSANAIKTANSVYSTIVDQPIYHNVVVGLEKPNVEMTAQYYVNALRRDERLILPMQKFHNFVKNQLISQFKGGTLVDVACGVGGDISKYEGSFSLVLGFDISFDGIFGNNDSAWMRYESLKKPGNKARGGSGLPPPMLFLQRDMGKRLGALDEDEAVGDKKDFQVLSKYVRRVDEDERNASEDLIKHFNEELDPKATSKILKYLEPFRNAVDSGFDVVSCQFALHYLFTDDTTLNNFCKNVDDLLKPGGYFIGTCLDGNKVHDALKNEPNRILEGLIDGNVVWRIAKDGDYEDLEGTGCAIDVFVESIGQSRREYLVDMELLKEKLGNYGIGIDGKDKKTGIKSFESKFNDSAHRMDKQDAALKKYSGMNQWFVFKKNTKSSS